MIGTTLAGATIAVAILFLSMRKWWTGGRALKDLVPTVQGLITGAMSTVCVGGLAGWLSGCTRQAVNFGGGTAVSGTTGTVSSGPIATGSMGALSEEGGVVVFLLFVATIAAYKAFNKEEKGRLTGAIVAGSILCATAGVAGALDSLPGIANGLGAAGVSLFEGQGL
ncbi:hypothetical protein [Streptomyces sp. 35G-GA-8]|uniref:hypothetical protein n=1 Tax=Streptomyces sp. 35G-GA-8 TaxID=2939434 RepID=UPI00201F8633|nr:hypothetical protein [Streptomyces sp. 35G-GA-8]MCL7377459.1 hypothetical protein [Streptomyces sp. 35G-GA-8]